MQKRFPYPLKVPEEALEKQRQPYLTLFSIPFFLFSPPWLPDTDTCVASAISCVEKDFRSPEATFIITPSPRQGSTTPGPLLVHSHPSTNSHHGTLLLESEDGHQSPVTTGAAGLPLPLCRELHHESSKTSATSGCAVSLCQLACFTSPWGDHLSNPSIRRPLQSALVQ